MEDFLEEATCQAAIQSYSAWQGPEEEECLGVLQVCAKPQEQTNSCESKLQED